ncbi:hypothetical protein C343_06513 [Cryptococcus neoformans C23]|uniref:Uncharacterized protein n=2 Tax=Cryptococcus neoformans TaxID=5207 RepID=A0A854QA14_CRYNE|nr:hypothetical protein CNAG_06298 [Cryptococcus neoformans var. grubii H99]AUB28694.1 hypothetical protein CKF44_06298 [Cryptococcus neoformans var. grubii]OWZ26863.1 hypothetical protein C347_06511 [Cryptococcus neoformans var. grubii AD2-60a]OWZ28276.1 hypothetical protein C356_06486 [Cryptococcus neoformans var. grubii c45]OWZ28307.1 hypothetical protein C353_06539 [Cryptococcus neoformans var. grubii AD1-83a]OWZ38724.1 hypothetical protein C343_06513 [Cryptococcus neoformans var. grubii C|eukprot:XP_012053393.1 hypothetical protein CNAG_06298 [Cryptococcus neoformans var. grubii H99]
MFAARSLLRSSTMPMARNMMTRKISTAAPAHMGPIRAFFHDVPIPVDAYPLVGIVVVMCSGATYMLSKHIYEDRDHLRWAPQRGGVKFLLPSQ